MSSKLHVWRYLFFSAFFLALVTHGKFSMGISFNICFLLCQYRSIINCKNYMDKKAFYKSGHFRACQKFGGIGVYGSSK
jgi:hypothetical protein